MPGTERLVFGPPVSGFKDRTRTFDFFEGTFLILIFKTMNQINRQGLPSENPGKKK